MNGARDVSVRPSIPQRERLRTSADTLVELLMPRGKAGGELSPDWARRAQRSWLSLLPRRLIPDSLP